MDIQAKESQAELKAAMSEIKAVMDKYQCIGSVTISQGKGISEHYFGIETPWSIAHYEVDSEGRAIIRVKTHKQNKNADPSEKDAEFRNMEKTINAISHAKDLTEYHAAILLKTLEALIADLDEHEKHGKELHKSIEAFGEFSETHLSVLEKLKQLNQELSKVLHTEHGERKFYPHNEGKN